jgi:HPt (histidine-containing phosphotransfer) domain-containing protein
MRRDLLGAFDVEQLEAYCGGDRAVVSEVLGLFREQAALWMRLLDDPHAGAGFTDAAHTLKGAAAGLFAERLAQACDAAERRGSDADVGERSALADRVKDAIDPVLFDIAAYLHAEAVAGLKTRPSA